MKYLLDTDFKDKSEADLIKAIKSKDKDLADRALGTTPRRYTDLIGSLCDLTSGSGDKGTPIVLIQGYFDNYAS
jgi:F420-0:gamma-glutamyl ligase